MKQMWKRKNPPGSETELPYDPAILLLDTYPKEFKVGMQTYLCTSAHSHTIHNNQKTQTTQVPTNRQMGKPNAVYTYNGMLSRHEKEWSPDTRYHVDEPWQY